MGIIPLRRPACWRDARWLGLCNKLREHTPDTGALGDASDHAHLACANRAQQKQRLVFDDNYLGRLTTTMLAG